MKSRKHWKNKVIYLFFNYGNNQTQGRRLSDSSQRRQDFIRQKNKCTWRWNMVFSVMTSGIQRISRGVCYQRDTRRSRNKNKKHKHGTIHQWYISWREKTLHNTICYLWLWWMRTQSHGTGKMRKTRTSRTGKFSHSIIFTDRKY